MCACGRGWLTRSLAVQLQIEEVSRKLRSGDLGIPANIEERYAHHAHYALCALYASAAAPTMSIRTDVFITISVATAPLAGARLCGRTRSLSIISSNRAPLFYNDK